MDHNNIDDNYALQEVCQFDEHATKVASQGKVRKIPVIEPRQHN
jgi:hypothetical protein